MKKATVLMIIAVICTSFVFKGFAGGGDKMPKIYQKMEDKAVNMNKKGALAVIGLAVSSRMDIGKNKAIEDAKKQIAEQRKNYVEASVNDFKKEIGGGKGAEIDEVFTQVIESVAATIINGAMVYDFTYFETKADKKEGSATYIVLYVITTEAMQKSLEAELKNKGSKANLYQLYMESEAKKNHDKAIQEFKAMEENK
jgi:hypothetical protein